MNLKAVYSSTERFPQYALRSWALVQSMLLYEFYFCRIMSVIGGQEKYGSFIMEHSTVTINEQTVESMCEGTFLVVRIWSGDFLRKFLWSLGGGVPRRVTYFRTVGPVPGCHVARDFSEKSETRNLITTKGPRRLELFQEKCKNGLTRTEYQADNYETHVNFWIRLNRTFNVWEQFTFYTVSVPQTMISGHALVVLVGPTWSWANFLEDKFEVILK